MDNQGTGEAQTTASEQRRAARSNRILYADLQGRYAEYAGMVVNASRTGALVTIVDPAFRSSIGSDMGLAGLRIASLFGEGLLIRFRDSDLKVSTEVVRLDESWVDDVWAFSIGCRFLRPLTAAQAALIGIDDRDLAPEPGKEGGTVVIHAAADGDSSFRPVDGALETMDRVLVQVDDGQAPMSIQEILERAVELQATDVHIKAESPVRFRVDGELHKLGDRVLEPEDSRGLVCDLLTQDQLEEFGKNGDLDAAYALEGCGRFRVNVMMSCGAMGMAIRRIPEGIPELGALGLAPACQRLAEKRRGLVLVTGPTGSGKSTTLAAMLHHVNRTRPCHILTMEDPIEFKHKEIRAHITQREIGRDTRDFGSALRRALRQDPDVVLVGEMRDLETVALAVTAAETGHLVFATLHTTSAVQSVDRIIDVFPAAQQGQIRMQLADSLEGIVSQVLVPRIGGGLVAIQEILIASGAVRALVREGKTAMIRNMMQTGTAEGMQTLDAALDAQVRAGAIGYDTAIALAHTPADIVDPRQARRRTRAR